MKFFSAAALIIALLAPLAASAAAPTLIVTTGQGNASATPDRATLSLTIETNASSASAASSKNNTIYNRVVSAFGAIGIQKSSVHTQSYTMYYNPPPQPSEGVPVPAAQQRYGYFVNRGLRVDLPNTAIAGKAIDAAAEAGVTNVGGVEFSVADQSGLTARALQAAVVDARKQAEAIASAAGLRIVRIRQIQEGYAQEPVPLMRAAAMIVNPSTEIPPGNVSATENVTVTFEAQ